MTDVQVVIPVTPVTVHELVVEDGATAPVGPVTVAVNANAVPSAAVA